MPFFPPLEDAPEPEEPQEWSPPIWHQPDEDEIPVTGGEAVVLGRSDGAAIVLEPVEVFSAGLRIPLRIVLRRLSGERRRDWYDRWQRLFGAFGESHGPRFGVRLADGTALFGVIPTGPPDVQPEGPRLTPVGGGGGGGGGSRYEQRVLLWLWPFPQGSLEMVAEWASAGIPETEHTIDGDALAPLRARVGRLWG